MASKPNYKMLTFQKIIDEIGVSKDKDIFKLSLFMIIDIKYLKLLKKYLNIL